MKSRSQLRALTITSVLALLMMLAGMLSTPVTTFAEGFGPEPPNLDPNPTDTLNYVPSDTTSTSSVLSETTDPSLLDVVITVLDVII